MAPSRVESSFEPNFEIESSLRVSSTRIFRVSSPVLEARLGSLRVESSRVFFLLGSTRICSKFLCVAYKIAFLAANSDNLYAT